MVPLRPYLLGGVAAAALIAAAAAGFLSIAAAVSESTLQDGIRAVATPQPDTLNIGAGKGPARPASPGGSTRAAVSLAAGRYRAPDVRSAATDEAPGEQTQGRTPHGASHSAPDPPPPGDPGNGGTPSVDAGNGGTGAGGPVSHAGSPPAQAPARPSPPHHPVIAKKPGGQPPGLAKKHGGQPPGLAKKPGGQPPGLAKKHG